MIIGLENELSVSACGGYTKLSRKQLIGEILNNLKSVVPAVPSREGAPSPPGFMLANGSRIYQDVGDYLEIAGPEVRTPIEALLYQRANEVLLLMVLQRISRSLSIDPKSVMIVRASTDYNGHYRGTHVNVTARNYDADLLVEHLTPFLVTRFYAYAGGFGPGGFVVSQKNSAIKTVASKDTREQRGIVNLKHEPLADSTYKRIHITHGEACMSDLANLLSVGCTALVVKMLDDGACVGPSYTLADPIRTLRELDTDFNWSKPLELASGLAATPLEIQQHYLNASDTYAQKHDELWMKQVVENWRWAVDTLGSQGPAGLSRVLDPYIKLKLYSSHLRKNGITLRQFSQWSTAAAMTKPYFDDKTRKDTRNYLRERMPGVSFGFVQEHINRCQLDWRFLPRAIHLYNEMVSLDLGFHDIDANRGLYFRLRDTGVVDSRLIEDSQLSEAMRCPPSNTRAYARGRAIREAAFEEGTVANWQEVKNANRRAYFGDPLSTTYSWQPLKSPGAKK